MCHVLEWIPLLLTSYHFPDVPLTVRSGMLQGSTHSLHFIFHAATVSTTPGSPSHFASCPAHPDDPARRAVGCKISLSMGNFMGRWLRWRQHCVSRIILLPINKLVGNSELLGIFVCDFALGHVTQVPRHTSGCRSIPISKGLST